MTVKTTKIEWVRNSDGSPGYILNPVKGLCPLACDYCYAKRLYQRFKWNPEIRFEFSALNSLAKLKEGSRVFIGSTIELFDDAIPHLWLENIFSVIRQVPWVTCIFLTKLPRNLIRWSPFPENCWVGATVTDDYDLILPNNAQFLAQVEAQIRFISFEPLLGSIATSIIGSPSLPIDWVIIGQQTPVSAKTAPKISDIDEIETACKKAGIPYFERNNLKSLLGRELVQDFPIR